MNDMTVIAENKVNFTKALAPTVLSVNTSDIAKALLTLENSPLPTTRTEAWKYTRLVKIGKVEFQNSEDSISSIAPYKIIDSACTFVFVNGHFSAEFSSREIPSGVTVELLSELSENFSATTLKLEDEIFNATNTAHLNGGVRISVSSKTVVEKPIQIIHVLKGDHVISNFKTIINAEKFSKSSIVQGFFTENGEANFCNCTSEINIEDNAFLTIDKVQYESEQSFHISTEEVQQAKNSNFTINTFTLNGGIVRNNLHINVNGENCESHLNGAYLLKNKQHVDNHTIVDHKVANCESFELYKGVMDDSSTGVFNGKVFVRKDAQKINAFQSNGNVLLSDNATINSKPELEIYADDVKCSHGSTTGQLDEEAVFYLRARGLSEKSARQLMVSAFIGEVLEKVENQQVLDFIHKVLKDRFDWNL
jgi:Fe-S cluster assembly protein SufD